MPRIINEPALLLLWRPIKATAVFLFFFFLFSLFFLLVLFSSFYQYYIKKSIIIYILKEKCLKQDINPIYTEIINILEEKIVWLKNELCLYHPKERLLLQSIPGIGPITAASFISEVGDIKRFKKPEHLAAYAGLDPRVHQSGISVRGKGYISKRGSKLLRTRLYNAASVAVLHENMFKAFFQKKKSEGKPHRVALVAAMRKMAHVIHAVWTRGTPFVK